MKNVCHFRQEKDILFIISGASGALGASYIDYIKSIGLDYFGISRNGSKIFLQADLLDKHQIERAFEKIDIIKYKKIIYIFILLENLSLKRQYQM